MDDWGKGSNVYGLIHADLGTKANVLFHKGEARAIDFDDSGYGYWMYDLTTPLYDWEDDEKLANISKSPYCWIYRNQVLIL